MASRPVRVMLFFSSYCPLLLIMGVLLWGKSLPWAIALPLVGVLSVVLTLLYLRSVRRGKRGVLTKVVEVHKRDADVMGYIASYLVPFVTFPIDAGWQLIVALVVFVGVLLLVYVNSNMIYINPMLNIFGYHLYEIRIEHGENDMYYIARKPVQRLQTIEFVRLGDDIGLER
jgi:hypothetical protein